MLTIENNGSAILFAREPTIEVKGITLLKGLYSSGAIYQKTRTQGQDLRVNGTVKLNMYMSDVYSWASLLDASGLLDRSLPILAYDELSSLPQAAFWSIILAPILLALAFTFHREKSTEK